MVEFYAGQMCQEVTLELIQIKTEIQSQIEIVSHIQQKGHLPQIKSKFIGFQSLD